MLLIDNRKGEYRMILRCDNCGREINDATAANCLFTRPKDAEGNFIDLAEYPLFGISCQKSCAHVSLGRGVGNEGHGLDDFWQLHQVLHMLKQTLNFQAALAEDQLYMMTTGEMPKRMYPKRPKTP